MKPRLYHWNGVWTCRILWLGFSSYVGQGNSPKEAYEMWRKGSK